MTFFSSIASCAGLTGLLLAATALSQQSVAPIKHLRNVNPYVTAAVADWERRSGRPLLPLQAGPRPHVLSGPHADGLQPVTGTSSFGMSGVNAHLLLTVPTRTLRGASQVTPPPKCPLQPAAFDRLLAFDGLLAFPGLLAFVGFLAFDRESPCPRGRI